MIDYKEWSLLDNILILKRFIAKGATLIGTDTEPYLFRASPSLGDYNAEHDEIVGASVGFNQLVQNGDFASADGWTSYGGTVAVSSGKLTFTATEKTNYAYVGRNDLAKSVTSHIYLSSAYITMSEASTKVAFSRGGVYSDKYFSVSANARTKCEKVFKATSEGVAFYIYPMREGNGIAVGSTMVVEEAQNIDLTSALGSTIADYIYTLEQGTAGAGVSFFRKYFGADYYPFDSGSIRSVEGLVSHTMRDGNDNIIGEYPLDSTVTLRGLLKLEDGKLKADGDIYKADGSVTRKYGVVDLGTLTWSYISESDRFSIDTLGAKGTGNDSIIGNIVPSGIFTVIKHTDFMNDFTLDNVMSLQWNGRLNARYQSASGDVNAFKTAMSGIYLCYELATPTTETATPYASKQKVDPSGTEEYVSTGVVPVGHNTEYYG